jgi:hypothetical protein
MASKEVGVVIKSLRAQGFTVVQSAGGHWEVFRPGADLDGRADSTFASTPSDYRGLENMRAQLRSIGWADPRKPAKKKGAR